jgi:hypothetical protein
LCVILNTPEGVADRLPIMMSGKYLTLLGCDHHEGTSSARVAALPKCGQETFHRRHLRDRRESFRVKHLCALGVFGGESISATLGAKRRGSSRRFRFSAFRRAAVIALLGKSHQLIWALSYSWFRRRTGPLPGSAPVWVRRKTGA